MIVDNRSHDRTAMQIVFAMSLNIEQFTDKAQATVQAAIQLQKITDEPSLANHTMIGCG